MKYKVVRINKDTIELGDDNFNISEYPLAWVSYAKPKVGDTVLVYKSADNGVTTVAIAKSDENNEVVQSGGYYAKEKSMNKHIFIWIGTFLFGCIGVDRFMRGQIALGIIKLVTVGGGGMWSLIDFIIALVKCYGSAFSDTEEVTFINGSYGR